MCNMYEIEADKIDKAIMIDRRIKEDKKELDKLKAEMQAVALAKMENKNLKYVECFGNEGSVFVTYKESVEIDNYKILASLVGESVLDKIKREESIKYKFDDKIKKALTAVYKKDYANHDITAILLGLGLDNDKIKIANKKLKGDYIKDKETLESLGINAESLEEEIDAIREQKNYELVCKFFDNPAAIDLKALGRALSIEDGLSIGLNYATEQ